jgi:hypothetical protein
MQKQSLSPAGSSAPAYPFSGRELYSDLRRRLSQHAPVPISVERLARMIGQSRSTTHHWFEVFAHPHVISFMCLLERLPEQERQDFVAAHCRALPALTHPALAHSPATVGRLQELLFERRALTFVCGGDAWARNFLISALGRWIEDRAAANQVCGIDLHAPRELVPLANVMHLDPALLSFPQMQKVIGDLTPELFAASRKFVLYNGLWSIMPELRPMMLHGSSTNHVIIGDAGLPNLRHLKHVLTARITILQVAPSKQKKGAILVAARSIRKPRKKAAR